MERYGMAGLRAVTKRSGAERNMASFLSIDGRIHLRWFPSRTSSHAISRRIDLFRFALRSALDFLRWRRLALPLYRIFNLHLHPLLHPLPPCTIPLLPLPHPAPILFLPTANVYAPPPQHPSHSLHLVRPHAQPPYHLSHAPQHDLVLLRRVLYPALPARWRALRGQGILPGHPAEELVGEEGGGGGGGGGEEEGCCGLVGGVSWLVLRMGEGEG